EAAGVEAGFEWRPDVPPAVQVAHDERRVHEPIVFRESRTRRLSRLQGLEDDARGEYSRLDRVVDALERRHVHETGRVAQDHQAVARAARRDGIIAALGDGLGAAP